MQTDTRETITACVERFLEYRLVNFGRDTKLSSKILHHSTIQADIDRHAAQAVKRGEDRVDGCICELIENWMFDGREKFLNAVNNILEVEGQPPLEDEDLTQPVLQDVTAALYSWHAEGWSPDYSLENIEEFLPLTNGHVWDVAGIDAADSDKPETENAQLDAEMDIRFEAAHAIAEHLESVLRAEIARLFSRKENLLPFVEQAVKKVQQERAAKVQQNPTALRIDRLPRQPRQSSHSTSEVISDHDETAAR